MLREFLIISLALQWTTQLISNPIFDGINLAQSVVKQEFDNRVVNSTKLFVALESPDDFTFESLDFRFKQRLADSFGQIVDNLIQELIENSQKTIDSLFQFEKLV